MLKSVAAADVAATLADIATPHRRMAQLSLPVPRAQAFQSSSSRTLVQG
jgi:hypothetical protein